MVKLQGTVYIGTEHRSLRRFYEAKVLYTITTDFTELIVNPSFLCHFIMYI